MLLRRHRKAPEAVEVETKEEVKAPTEAVEEAPAKKAPAKKKAPTKSIKKAGASNGSSNSKRKA